MSVTSFTTLRSSMRPRDFDLLFLLISRGDFWGDRHRTFFVVQRELGVGRIETPGGRPREDTVTQSKEVTEGY